MEISSIKNINKHFQLAIQRCQINQVICVNYSFQDKYKSFKQLDKDFKLNEKIMQANLLYFFNNIEDVKSKIVVDVLSENKAISNQFKDTINKISHQTKDLIDRGYDIFELNKCFSGLFDQINISIAEMNYDSWLAKKHPNINEGVLYLLLQKKHKTYKRLELGIDFSEGQKKQIKEAFNFRKKELKYLRSIIIELYAKYLFMTQTTQIPKFNYTCGKVDICELALAIELCTEIEQAKKLSQVFLAMFDIGNDEYSKAQRQIKVRIKDKNAFTSKLSEQIKKLRSPQKKNTLVK
jgi:hypothetical protein